MPLYACGLPVHPVGWSRDNKLEWYRLAVIAPTGYVSTYTIGDPRLSADGGLAEIEQVLHGMLKGGCRPWSQPPLDPQHDDIPF